MLKGEDRKANTRMLTTGFGMITSLDMLGRLVGPYLGGQIQEVRLTRGLQRVQDTATDKIDASAFEKVSSYDTAFIVGLACSVFGASTTLLLKETKMKTQFTRSRWNDAIPGASLVQSFTTLLRTGAQVSFNTVA